MKKVISILTVAFLLFTFIPTITNALVVDDWEIEISNGEAYIIGFSGTCPDKMTLPTKIGNFSVVGLKANIFTDNVSEIIIPEGYKYIEILNSYGRSFYNLKDSLEEIKLPSTLLEFKVRFAGFSKLTSITIPGSVKKIDDETFKNCHSLKNIYLENGLECIGSEAFSGCINLLDFTIPNTVTVICGQAFMNCDSLKNMVIPNSVHTFGNDQKYTFGSKTNFRAVFYSCENLETVVLSDSIQTICTDYVMGTGELSDCPNLKSVYIGKSVSILGTSVFAQEGVLGKCDSMKTVVVPEGVTDLGPSAFSNDSNLEAVILPKSLTAGPRSFLQYKGLEDGKPLPKLFIYGYKGTYAETIANNGGMPFVDISVATPTNSKVLINGKEVAFTAYNIGGNNYFKLRDIASAINGTNKNFNVGWDGNNNAITLTSNSAYSNVGGELVVNSNAVATEPKISNPKIFVDGKLTTFMAFNIDGNNYIKLRDLGEAFNFGVEWNGTTQTIEINTNKGYSK